MSHYLIQQHVVLAECVVCVQTYFNSNVPLLVSTLVTGGDTPLLEAQLVRDNKLKGGVLTSQLWALRRRSKLAQLALQVQPLCQLQVKENTHTHTENTHTLITHAHTHT